MKEATFTCQAKAQASIKFNKVNPDYNGLHCIGMPTVTGDNRAEHLHAAAVTLAGRKGRRSSSQLSRITDKSYILIGLDGEILARFRLQDVERMSQQLLEREDANSKTLEARPERKMQILIGIALVAISIGMVKWAQETVLSAKINEEVDRNKSMYDRLQSLSDEFSQFQQIASSTARIALSAPVTKLQEVQMRTESIKMPECLTDSKNRLSRGQAEIISGFVTFMDSSNSEFDAATKIATGSAQVEQALRSAKQCTSSTYIRSKLQN